MKEREAQSPPERQAPRQAVGQRGGDPPLEEGSQSQRQVGPKKREEGWPRDPEPPDPEDEGRLGEGPEGPWDRQQPDKEGPSR